MRASWLGIAVLSVALLGPTGEARAEEWPASVKGLKVVVPDARGRRAYGGRRLTRSLRKTLTEALGPLVSSKDLKKAQRKLKLRGKRARSDEGLAKAGREAGAQWVLDVQLTKKKWLYTATARLINTETGAEQMNFRSQFYKPKSETKDRGFRIARKTIEKLDLLTREGPLPAVGPVADGTRPGSDPTAMAPPSDMTGDDVGTPPPAPPVDVPNGPAPLADDAGPSGGSSGSAAPVAAASTPIPRTRRDDTELLRVDLGAGSGLLRTYDLSSNAVADSRLSYNLSPMTLVALGAEIIVPDVPVTAVVQAAFRPFTYQVGVPDQGDVEASGLFLDTRFLVGYHIPLAGSGRSAYRIIPRLGARLGLNTVGEEAQDFVLSTTAVTVEFGALGRLPINEVLEVNVGVDGGWIASYSESDSVSGNSGGGFSVGADLGARIWLSSAIAVAIDNRFTYEQISFDGTPTRPVPRTESTNLQNVGVTTRDLRTSIGVAFRL